MTLGLDKRTCIKHTLAFFGNEFVFCSSAYDCRPLIRFLWIRYPGMGVFFFLLLQPERNSNGFCG